MSLPFDFAALTKGDLCGVGLGIASDVVRIADTDVVAKIPQISEFLGQEVHDVEKRIYERLAPGHPNVLKYLGQSPPECTMLRGALLFQYHPRGTFADRLNDLKSIPERSCWLHQAANALAFIHAKGVVHSDLGLHNILLADDGGIVLCDFAGSSIDGCRAYVAHATRYSNPLWATEDTTQRDDVFALGTLLYELHRGEKLFADLNDAEIVARFKNLEFPDLSNVPMPLRDVILKCWTLPQYTASDASKELEPPPQYRNSVIARRCLGLQFVRSGSRSSDYPQL